MARLPGHKESRYMHCFADPSQAFADSPPSADPSPAAGETDRLDRLEEKVRAIGDELADLKTAFESFRRQFE
jgi:uncharacterized protein YceH (UPF0502 family)